MTEPTALAQLRHLYQNMVNGVVRDTASAKRIAEGLLAPAIEALERATPSAVAGEPVAWMGTHDITDLYYRKPPQADVVPLYATPQPTQAQAGARQEALEEAAKVCAEIGTDYWMGDAQFEAATRCRNATLAMGIKGGLHES